MKHYNIEMWSAFYLKTLRHDVYSEMEQHLYCCNKCLELYIRQAEKELADKKRIKIPHYFNGKLSEAIKTERKRESRDSRNRLILYYTAAAFITTVLVTTGLFNRVIDITGRAVSNITDSGVRAGSIFNNK